MSPHQTVALLVRLFCVGLVVHSFQTAFFSLEMSDPVYTRIAIAYFGIALIFSAILWKFPLLIARSMIKPDSESEEPSDWSKNEFYCFGFVVVGLLWLVLALSDLVYWFSFAIYGSHFDSYSNQLDADQKAAIVSTLFEVIIALTLIFGAKGWFRLVSFLRFGIKNSGKSS
ncbi:MAG: hypothetical protein AAF465_04320 [Pseudomonadota bacterium]